MFKLKDKEITTILFCLTGPISDSFTILGLWVLVLPVSHIIESNCNRIQNTIFNDKSAILLHPGTR